MLHNRLLSRTGSITTISILCGILFLLIGVATSHSRVRAQNNNGIVESDGLLLNVREGPGSDYTILQQLEDQDAVEILDTDSTGNWYEISFESEFSDVGWVFAAYIRQLEEGENDEVEDQPKEQVDEAGLGDTDFSALPNEERAAIVIARLELAATEVARIVEAATATSDASAEIEGTPTPQSAEALQSSENERSAAADARKDFAVTVVARAQIAKTEIAKILSAATAAASQQDTPTPEPTSADDTIDSEAEKSSAAESTGTAVTVIERMNLYSGPGTHYTILATVEAGSVFDVMALDAKSRWYQVQLEGQTEMAWLYSGLVEVGGDVEVLPRILETIPTRIPQATPTQMVVADPNIPPTPTVRPLMEASDPASFDIASGQIQVVEFFGFW